MGKESSAGSQPGLPGAALPIAGRVNTWFPANGGAGSPHSLPDVLEGKRGVQRLPTW